MMEILLRALTSTVLLTIVLHPSDCAIMTVTNGVSEDLVRIDINSQHFDCLSRCLSHDNTESCTMRLSQKSAPSDFEMTALGREPPNAEGIVSRSWSWSLTPVYYCVYQPNSMTMTCKRVPSEEVCSFQGVRYEYAIVRNSTKGYIVDDGLWNLTRISEGGNGRTCLVTYYDTDCTIAYIMMTVVGFVFCMGMLLIFCVYRTKHESKESQTEESRLSDAVEILPSKRQEGQLSQAQESHLSQTGDSKQSQNQGSELLPAEPTLHNIPPSYQEALGIPSVIIV